MRVGNSSSIETIRVGSSPVIAVARGSTLDIEVPDPASTEYFSRASITNATVKTRVDNFVKYCKNAGIWDSLYCFPLTASSLQEPLGGRVLTYLTASDRPQISGTGVSIAEGLTFSGTADRLVNFDTFGQVSGTAPWTMIAAARVSNMSSPSTGSILASQNNTILIVQPQNNATSSAVLVLGSTQIFSGFTFSNTTDHALIIVSQSANGNIFWSINAASPAISGGGLSSIGDKFFLGSAASGGPTTDRLFNGAISFVGVLNNYAFTSSDMGQYSGLYNTLKSTILNGLLA